MKLQSFVGVFLVAVFVLSTVAVSKSDLSLVRIAAAGYGNDNGGNHKKQKKHKKVSQVKVQKKIAEFKIHNNAKDIDSYRRVSAIKKSNPAQFKALQNVFNKYNKVGGKLKVQPSAQTVSAINMFRGYNGYSAYLNYVGKLKK